MSYKGFVIYAEGPEYVKQAYLAALSLKASNNSYPISIITNDQICQKYSKIFDEVIEIPDYKKSKSDLCVESRSKIYELSPYNQTIVLDSDVLILENLDYFWNFVQNYTIYFPTTVFTYRKEKIVSNYYRKVFTINKLPNFYNCLCYFQKGDFAQTFYQWVEYVSNNWQEFYKIFCKENNPKQPSMDVTTAIAARILDCETELFSQNHELLEIVHMKTMAQNWFNPTSRWQDRVGVYLSEDLQLKIGNHRQNTVFHYTEKDFCTDNIIGKFEKCLDI
jgi:hypothetical protein